MPKKAVIPEVETEDIGHVTYAELFESASPGDREKMRLLKNQGMFSETEIVDLVLGRRAVVQMIFPTLWFRPKDILEQKDALIYLIRLILNKPCNGSEEIKLSGRDFELASYAFAEGLFTENIRSKSHRSFEKCLRYAKRQIRNLLNKHEEFQASASDQAMKIIRDTRKGQGSNDPQIRELCKLRELINAKIDERQKEVMGEKAFATIDFSVISQDLLNKLGLNPDGSKKVG